MTVISSRDSMVLLAHFEGLAVRNSGSTEDPTQSNKSILQHLYFIIAVIVVLLLVALRIHLLRRRNRPITDFFSIGPASRYYGSQAHESHTFGSSYQHSSLVPLAPLPLAYRRGRRVNAADIDTAGRRLGEPDDPDWDGKDILPAYNHTDRPPKYDSSGVLPQGYICPHGINPGDDSVAADAEALPVAEQTLTDTTSAIHSERVEHAPFAPHHVFPDASS